MALIVCVIGHTGSGKSFAVDNCFPQPLWIQGRPGRMIRQSIGMYHADLEENPNRFDLTEHLVRDYVYRLVEIADRVRRPVVLDGFPRDRGQAEWFFSQFADHETIIMPVKDQSKMFHVDGDLEEKRHMRSVEDVASVIEEAISRRILVKEVKVPWTER